jgi:hypothetical protein
MCLYVYIAVWFTENNKPMYYLARVQRIKRKYKKAFVEYIRPVSLQDRLKDVYIQVNWYTLSLVNGMSTSMTPAPMLLCMIWQVLSQVLPYNTMQRWMHLDLRKVTKKS